MNPKTQTTLISLKETTHKIKAESVAKAETPAPQVLLEQSAVRHRRAGPSFGLSI